MAGSKVHTELAAISKSSPAGYITITPFARLTLGRLLSAANLLKGKLIPAGSGMLSATLTDVIWATAPNASLVDRIDPNVPPGNLDVLISSSFDVLVDIFITGDPAKRVSQVKMSISNARAHLRAENDAIILEGSDYDAQRSIIRYPDADTLLAAAGIDPLEAAHVEGHIGYGVVSQAVANALGQRQEIKLSTIFPAVNFGSSIKLAILNSGAALGIIPTETVTLNRSAVCTCQEGPDYEVTRSSVTNTAPPNPKPNDQIGAVVIGGPVADNKDPMRDFGRRKPDRDGLFGLYIPQAFAKDLVVDVMPAIKVVAQDNGTIGFRAEATVGFKNFVVSLDVAGGGILLDIDLDISMSAYCDFEVFKGVRLPIGWAIIAPAQLSQASLQIGFYPSVDGSGTVKLKSTLKKCDMGSYVAVVIGIGTALKFLGVTAWIGFLIDVVLATILSTRLPIALKKVVSDHVASKEWKLLDGLQVVDPIQPMYPIAPFDAKADSLLASFDSQG